MPDLNITPFLTLLSLLGTVTFLALLSFWPVFLERMKNRHFYWIGSLMLIAALGAWAMIYFQLERNRIRTAEAEAVESTRAALADGREITGVLQLLWQSEEFQSGSAATRYRLWSNAVKGAGK